MTDILSQMVEAASLAPSIHNSQPWSFRVAGDRLEISIDQRRATPAIDPVGRGLRIACGAAALNAQVVGRAAGRACALVLGPTADRPELVAGLTLGATITPSADDLALARAVPLRHTVRTAFAAEPVGDNLVDQLRAAVELEGAWMHVVSRDEDVVELAVVSQSAEAAEQADERYRKELEAWTRTEKHAADGIPLDCLPARGTVSRAADIPVRDFQPRVTPPELAEEAEGPPAAERPLLVIIGTDVDTEIDWLHAGMALQRLWLTATALGIGASPLTQALDHAGSRAMLSRVVGLDHGHPQMLLRLGYAHAEAVTGRRPVRDVLVDR